MSRETPAFNVNRLCGSGLQAILLAAQALRMGDAEIAIGAGAESMSRGPYLLSSARWGARMGDSAAHDYTLGILHDPFHRIYMGITAENVAAQEGVTREAQDALAIESQRRAARAIADGRFTSQLVAVPVATRNGTVQFETDEHVRADVTAEQLAKMKPVFQPDGGTVTVGNASGLNDGASAVVLATASAVRTHGLKPLARVVSHGHAGLDPKLMGLGPVPATRLALQRAGLTVATENLELKMRILRQLDEVVGPDAVIATNTSSISITQLAAVVTRPERFIGTHFFNPVPLMPLLELIRGLQTSGATHSFALEFARTIGKTPITARNSPGFAVNRILCPMINEAIFALQEGLATAEDIDTGMQLGCNHPIGPLALADMIGLDTLLAVLEVFHDGFNDPKYRPAPLLKEMVAAGRLGRKSGRGFYAYA